MPDSTLTAQGNLTDDYKQLQITQLEAQAGDIKLTASGNADFSQDPFAMKVDFSTNFFALPGKETYWKKLKQYGKSIEELHFHEVGCADAVADIIGASYAYHLLKFDEEKIISLPVATGNGSINTQHGILPVPAPAVISILKDVPTVGGKENTELATPTGCAILVNIVDEFKKAYPDKIIFPISAIKIIGYGAGKKDLNVLNALRVIYAENSTHENTITILETNIDTLSGEILGNIYDKLLDAGARDVSITPTFMKKNRPGHIVKVIAKNEDAEKLVRMLMEETGTLGVRMLPYIHRGVAIRENVVHKVEINGEFEEVRFKIGEIDNKIIKCSAEYDDLKKLSVKTGIPVKDLKEYVELDYKRKF